MIAKSNKSNKSRGCQYPELIVSIESAEKIAGKQHLSIAFFRAAFTSTAARQQYLIASVRKVAEDIALMPSAHL
jgi:hypothetical protein